MAAGGHTSRPLPGAGTGQGRIHTAAQRPVGRRPGPAAGIGSGAGTACPVADPRTLSTGGGDLRCRPCVGYLADGQSSSALASVGTVSAACSSSPSVAWAGSTTVIPGAGCRVQPPAGHRHPSHASGAQSGSPCARHPGTHGQGHDAGAGARAGPGAGAGGGGVSPRGNLDGCRASRSGRSIRPPSGAGRASAGPAAASVHGAGRDRPRLWTAAHTPRGYRVVSCRGNAASTPASARCQVRTARVRAVRSSTSTLIPAMPTCTCGRPSAACSPERARTALG